MFSAAEIADVGFRRVRNARRPPVQVRNRLFRVRDEFVRAFLLVQHLADESERVVEVGAEGVVQIARIDADDRRVEFVLQAVGLFRARVGPNDEVRVAFEEQLRVGTLPGPDGRELLEFGTGENVRPERTLFVLRLQSLDADHAVRRAQIRDEPERTRPQPDDALDARRNGHVPSGGVRHGPRAAACVFRPGVARRGRSFRAIRVGRGRRVRSLRPGTPREQRHAERAGERPPQKPPSRPLFLHRYNELTANP